MVEIFSLLNESFGLEITDASIRVMKLKRRGKEIRVVSVGVAELPAGAIKEGDVKDEDKLAAAIKEAVAKAAGEKIKTKYAVVSLPENKAFLQVIKMPQLKNDDLRAAVTFEAENYIPLPLEKVYLDFEPVENGSTENDPDCEVMIAALPRDPVDALIKAITKAGLVPVAMELESGAICRALSHERDLESPVIMAHIGDTKTIIIIYADNSVRFTFSIPISNRYFLEMIAKSAGVGISEAADLKRKCNIEEFVKPEQVFEAEARSDREKIIKRIQREENYEKEKIFEALVPGLVDFTQQIKKCITYYQTHYNGKSAAGDAIDKILLCGSGSELKGLGEFIEMKLGITVERAKLAVAKDVLEHYREERGASYEPGGFIAVFGLALRALASDGKTKKDESKSKKNIVVPKPPAVKRRLSVKKS